MSWSSSAGAQAAPNASDPRVAEARRHFQDGVAHHEDERYSLAAEAFRRAHELLREAGDRGAPLMLYNLGTSLEELPGREVEARDAYERFLRESNGADPVVQQRLVTVQQRLRELEARIGARAVAPAGSAPVGPILVTSLGGALAVAAGILLGVGFAERSAVENAEPGTAWRDVAGSYDRAQAFVLAGEIGLGVGLATAAGGLLWLALGADGPNETAVGLSPAAMNLRGSF